VLRPQIFCGALIRELANVKEFKVQELKKRVDPVILRRMTLPARVEIPERGKVQKIYREDTETLRARRREEQEPKRNPSLRSG
jgi:hypothetical protein